MDDAGAYLVRAFVFGLRVSGCLFLDLMLCSRHMNMCVVTLKMLVSLRERRGSVYVCLYLCNVFLYVSMYICNLRIHILLSIYERIYE